jgi:pyruvate dehydrogenase E2 component (dihydrolipoyllysine-residue acetyltransferase)
MPRVPLLMPKMSMTMEFGTVEEWLVEVGGPVTDGDAVVVVTTDKVDMDVESTCDGTLIEVLAQPGEQVPVGEPIAWIDTEKDDLLGDLFAAPAAPSPDAVAPGSPADEQTPRAVPLARKLAAEAGLDLAALSPSGPHRTIRARDVRAAIEARAQAATAPAAATPPPVAAAPTAPASAAPVAPVASAATGELLGDAKSRRLRIATARVLESTALIPQFTVWRGLDLSRLAVARKASLSGVSWNTILLRAYALMLREYPSLNGSWAGDGVRANPHIGVALAIDTPAGLLAPVLRDPHTLGIRALDAAIKDLAAAVKAGKVDRNAMGGGTGTVSNLGSFGVERFNALLTPPQATALSLGTVEVRPVFDADGSIRPRTACEAGLTVDHRVADGADAARAFATMQAILDDPFALLG